ncbi:MAG: SWIB/MDM2 domain-containing protein [Telluria sp.]
MEFFVVLLVFGALWLGYQSGTESGRKGLLDAQSRTIAAALNSENDFFNTFGMHGQYLLDGLDDLQYSNLNFVIVKYSDLQRLRERSNEEYIDEDDSPNVHAPHEIDEILCEADCESEQLRVPSNHLAAIVGVQPISHSEAIRSVWVYIEENGLRGERSTQHFDCDSRLFALTGVKSCTLFLISRVVGENLS